MLDVAGVGWWGGAPGSRFCWQRAALSHRLETLAVLAVWFSTAAWSFFLLFLFVTQQQERKQRLEEIKAPRILSECVWTVPRLTGLETPANVPHLAKKQPLSEVENTEPWKKLFAFLS